MCFKFALTQLHTHTHRVDLVLRRRPSRRFASAGGAIPELSHRVPDPKGGKGALLLRALRGEEAGRAALGGEQVGARGSSSGLSSESWR